MRASLWPIAAVVVVFAAVGASHALKPAAGTSEAAQAARAKLAAVPATVGAWVGTDTTVPEKQLRIAEAEAHLSRTYARKSTGDSVAVLVLAGPPGPLGAHTPETCFAGAGFSSLGPPSARPGPDGAGSFWRADFATPGGLAVCRVLYGWSPDGQAWSAADDPRFAFAGRPLVFKLYASRTLSGAVPTPVQKADDAGEEFLKEFLKAIPPLP